MNPDLAVTRIGHGPQARGYNATMCIARTAVNIARARELTKLDRMRPAGLKAFEKRTEAKSEIYAYENRKSAILDKELEKLFRRETNAWRFINDQPPGYRQTLIWWIIGAKRDETRKKRLQRVIDSSKAGKRL
jgi:uncharacterized protein YdeI (YjbR/CyaY-like superfamily)